MTILSTADAIATAAALNADAEDGWLYIVAPVATGKAVISIIDEDGVFVANF